MLESAQAEMVLRPTVVLWSVVQSANEKDVIDSVKYPSWDLRDISDAAYTHPALAKGLTLDDAIPTVEELKEQQLVPVKAKYRRASNPASAASTPRTSRAPSPTRNGAHVTTKDELDPGDKV